ncbi:MAG: sigma 54-interacting transcriptional regulator [Ignavibacteria bacterium]|nr:sigma 54-interacting transcriptional regulator [Ignavibacteria bacterium]
MTESILNKHSIRILDSLSEGIYIIDKEFKIVYVNKAASEITGIKSSDVIGKVCRTFCKSERCQIGCPITEILRTGRNIVDLESSLQNSDGNIIPVKLNASVLKNEDDDPIGGIISFRRDSKISFDDYLKNKDHFYGIVGKSKAMKELFRIIEEISGSDANVLISGETGVGKEMVAQAIKETSKRRDKIFVKVNCAALPDTLLASELFGHVKGAFTDAVKDRIGRFEYADGGTIFLDEITEIPINMQNRLLRIIQEGTFERLGESIERKVNVRIIAATNKNIKDEVKSKSFREDLYYRLNVIPLYIPPLRERKEDIVYLVNYFIRKYADKYSKKIESVHSETMEILYNHDWPGNVRELENAIEYAIVRSKRQDYLCVCSLPPNIRDNIKCNKILSLKEIAIDEKTETLLTLLRQNNWNKTKVANILGINRSTIHRILKGKKNK